MSKLFVIQFILIGILFTGFFLFAADKIGCNEVSETLYNEQTKLGELNQLREDLEKRFQEYSKEDFSAQVEGIANELHRTKALKVAFAKRRLTKLIDSMIQDIASTTQVFCQKCRAQLGTENMRERYCENCPRPCSKSENSKVEP